MFTYLTIARYISCLVPISIHYPNDKCDKSYIEMSEEDNILLC